MIYPLSRAKFKEVVGIFNKMKKPIKITENEQGFEIEDISPQQLFELGRFYEPYKPSGGNNGSFIVHYDNNYLDKI
jgi:hypothetical protein